MSEEKRGSNDWEWRWLDRSVLTVADFVAISVDLDPLFFEGSNSEVSRRTSAILDRMDHPLTGRIVLRPCGFERPFRRDLVELWQQAKDQKTFDQDLREHPVNRLLSIDDAVLFAIEKKWNIPQWLRGLVGTCLTEAPPILTTTVASDIQVETPPTGPTPESLTGVESQIAPEDAQRDESGVSTDGMVAWQAEMIESWPEITKGHKGRPTARNAMKWLKKHGPRDVFPVEQPDHDALHWIDRDGNPQTVLYSSIAKRISEWRKAKKIPA